MGEKGRSGICYLHMLKANETNKHSGFGAHFMQNSILTFKKQVISMFRLLKERC